MKWYMGFLVLVLTTGLGLCIPLQGRSEDGTQGMDTQGGTVMPRDESTTSVDSDRTEETVASSVDDLIYNLPLRGAPGGRVAAGTRGDKSGSPMIIALVPDDHTGLSTQEQPTLCWFLSKSTNHPVELTISEDEAVRPLLETQFAPDAQKGIRCLSLADYGIRLKSGVRYRWFVTIVTDPEHRSKDISTGAEIERVEIQEALRSKLARSGKESVPKIYADAGLWYDAFAAVSELIVASPYDSILRKQRASLLRQVGLSKVEKDGDR